MRKLCLPVVREIELPAEAFFPTSFPAEGHLKARVSLVAGQSTACIELVKSFTALAGSVMARSSQSSVLRACEDGKVTLVGSWAPVISRVGMKPTP